MQRSISFLLTLFFISCNNTQNKTSTATNKQPPDSTHHEELIATTIGDTLRVYKKCAVFYRQDSAELQRRKKEIGEEDFYTGADDYVYYQSAARQFLDSVQLPIVDVQGQKVIKFMLNNEAVYTATIAAQADFMGVYFYNSPKEVLKPDMLDIGEDYESYFND